MSQSQCVELFDHPHRVAGADPSRRSVPAEEIQQAVVTVFPEEGAVLMATAAEQWMERGKQEGIVIGKQEGERNGLLAAIELGLELKFGATGLQLLPAIYHVTDLEVLRSLYKGARSLLNENRPIP